MRCISRFIVAFLMATELSIPGLFSEELCSLEHAMVSIYAVRKGDVLVEKNFEKKSHHNGCALGQSVRKPQNDGRKNKWLSFEITRNDPRNDPRGR